MVFNTCDLAIENYYTDIRSGVAADDESDISNISSSLSKKMLSLAP